MQSTSDGRVQNSKMRWGKIPYSHLEQGKPIKTALSTRLTAARHPIHRWFNFVPGFSPEFVEICCREKLLDKDEIVLDPFAGCGTTQVSCNLLGQSSYGYETHPFLFKIAEAKTKSLDIPISKVLWIKDRMVDLSRIDKKIKLSPDAHKFLMKIVPEEGLTALLKASLVENEVSYEEGLLCHVALSKVLELVCRSKTDGIYKAPTSAKRSTPFGSAVISVFEEILEDIRFAKKMKLVNRSRNYLQSSENMSQLPNESVSLAVTSPPYPNNFDYAEMTRMHLYFWRYASSWKEITNRVRVKLIVNTTTATRKVRNRQQEFRDKLPISIRRKIDPLVSKLKCRRLKKAGRKEYYLFLYPYFAQMSSVIREVGRVLRKGGEFHMIVADSALYGIHVKTEQLLADLMRFHGLSVIEIRLLRKRGTRWILKKRENIPGGLGDFHIISRKLG